MSQDAVHEYRVQLNIFTITLHELRNRFSSREAHYTTNRRALLGLVAERAEIGLDSLTFHNWYERIVFALPGAFQFGQCDVLEKHRSAREYLLERASEVEQVLQESGRGVDTLLHMLDAIKFDINIADGISRRLLVQLTGIETPSEEPIISELEKEVLMVHFRKKSSVDNLIGVKVGQGREGLLDFFDFTKFPDTSEDSVKPAIANLQRYGYLSKSKRGPGGGCYLTNKGYKRASSVLKNRAQ